MGNDVLADRSNVRLTVAYDGGGFHGFAESDGVRTVMGDLRRAIETVTRGPVELTGAGRTDAGVHAWGQVVSGFLPADTDLRRLVRSVNAMCAPEVSIRDAAWTTETFSARFSATARTYLYTIWNGSTPNPLLAARCWHVPHTLDIDAMNEGAAHLLGEHDFSSFCRRPRPVDDAAEVSLVRRLHLAGWTWPAGTVWGAGLVRLVISGSWFCHLLVRRIVGTLADVGRGRRRPDSIPSTLAARDRNAAGTVAPPSGLVLQSVDYRGERWDA